jgi:hypothetical protein
MHEHRTITRLATIAATVAVIAPAASAQAATAVHHKSHRRLGPISGPVLSAAYTSRKIIIPCHGGGPLARPPEFVSYSVSRPTRPATGAICVIEL